MLIFFVSALSAFAIYAGVVQWLKGAKLQATGKKAIATVVSNVRKHSSDGKAPVYYPVIRFTTEKNVVIEQQLHFGSNPPRPEGQQMDVLYDPEKPENVLKNSIMTLKIIPASMILFGIAGLGYAFYAYHK